MATRPVILCPVDSRPGMSNAAAYSLELARHLEADVHLLHVAPAPRPPRPELEGTDGHGVEVIDWSALTELARAAFSDGSRVRMVTHQGSAASVISAYAHLSRAALVVMDRNYGTFRWWRNRAVAMRLRRSSPCPLLVLPPSRTSAPATWNEILCAIDWTVASAVAVRTALDFARPRDAHLTLVHVLEVARDLLFSGAEALDVAARTGNKAAAAAASLRRRLSPDALRGVDVRFVNGAPDHRILDVASEVAADVIVLGVASQGPLDDILSASTSGTVLHRATRPVLFVPVMAGGHDWLEGVRTDAGDAWVP